MPTETENALRLSRYLDSLGAEPAPVRVTEKVLALLALFLLMAWIDGGNLAAQIVEEKHDRIMQTCERNTRVAVAALNGWQIQEGDVKVACRRVK